MKHVSSRSGNEGKGDKTYLAGKLLKVLADESVSAGRIGANASVKKVGLYGRSCGSV